jgi:hypothetical protein
LKAKNKPAPIETTETTEGLPAAVAQVYTVSKGLGLAFTSYRFGFIDLTQIDLKQAKQLAEAGYLIEKKVE